MSYVKFHATSSGNTTVVVAPGAGYRLVITAAFLQCGALTQVTLRSGTTSAGDLTGPMQFSAGGGLNLPYVGLNLFECGENQPFVISLGAGLAPDCAGAVLCNVEAL